MKCTARVTARKYDAMTGAVINGPASRPLAKLAVWVANGGAVTG